MGQQKLLGYRPLAEATRREHAKFYLTWLEQQKVYIRSDKQAEMFSALANELPNIETSWQWIMGHMSPYHSAQLAAVADILKRFFQGKGRLIEGEGFFIQSIKHLHTERQAGHAIGAMCSALAWLSLMIGKTELAEQLAKRSVILLNKAHDQHNLMLGFNTLGVIYGMQGNYSE